MSDPNDFSGKYNTPLRPAEMAGYQKWLSALPAQQRSTYDYDMQGAYRAGAGRAGNGHFPDTFKKPNHPTFSNQSQYSGQDGFVGGSWNDMGGGKWGYTASPTNLRFHSQPELNSYFQRVEPDSVLTIAPTLPIRGSQ